MTGAEVDSMMEKSALESAIKKTRRDLEELKSAIYTMRNKIDALEKYCRDNDRENKELQGKIATLAGRLDVVKGMIRG